MTNDQTFRVTGWPALPSRFSTLRFRRAVTAMSVSTVTQEWLEQHCGLSRRELNSLLRELDAAGLLDVGERSSGASEPPSHAEPIGGTFCAQRFAGAGALRALSRFAMGRMMFGSRKLGLRAVIPDLSEQQSTRRG